MFKMAQLSTRVCNQFSAVTVTSAKRSAFVVFSVPSDELRLDGGTQGPDTLTDRSHTYHCHPSHDRAAPCPQLWAARPTQHVWAPCRQAWREQRALRTRPTTSLKNRTARSSLLSARTPTPAEGECDSSRGTRSSVTKGWTGGDTWEGRGLPTRDDTDGDPGK